MSSAVALPTVACLSARLFDFQGRNLVNVSLGSTSLKLCDRETVYCIHHLRLSYTFIAYREYSMLPVTYKDMDVNAF